MPFAQGHHKDACSVCGHFDAKTVRVADAPRANDLVLAITITSGGRRHACRGGLKARKKAKMDGQR